MRKLTRSQKKLLDQAYEDGARDVESLPNEVWEKLQEINDTEILYQNVNNYLLDKLWERI